MKMHTTDPGFESACRIFN